MIGLALLAACHSAPADPFGTVADEDRIECRIGAASGFERVCIVERSIGRQGLTLVVRKPDGGFRRLLVTTDGRGVIAADGAEQAAVMAEGKDSILVAIGGDTYRLPSTVKAVRR